MHLDDFSAHPEWDQMYAAGLTATRIAELVEAPVSTVKRHLERRRAVDSALAADHAAAPKTPSDQWRRRLVELRDFVAKYGRCPAKSGKEDGETRLYAWLSHQRHAFVAQNLGWQKAKELGDQLGDWVTPDRQREEDVRWRQRLFASVEFVTERGRLPRHRPPRSPEESSLSIWLQTQRGHALRGKLADWRLDELDGRLPGWWLPRGGK
ncbi:helicase associated domain-containing protein [Arthrobacter sp. STN4]|uniref:helicase associated domain-containing protein n=1 Tax=Arthrobacter sp. STN4 TaxID=2923276 RepID=UPI00211A0763|nr:helicase associated domain-containing protein [Arthrobacter sp. STN4]MCQ9162976.1 helicase associated domain-containing protein [Arthrobacter sp. STN4]